VLSQSEPCLCRTSYTTSFPSSTAHYLQYHNMSKPTPIKGAEKLSSKWHLTEDLGGYDMPIRLEGEIGDVMVRGTIPNTIDGTFYRVAQDHFTPPTQGHLPLRGHGVVSAFRIHNGQVDFKIRYVQNDRYKLERSRKKSFWADIIDHPL
ncbi:Carotenoid oxygenase, partial [Macrophomina phaseolina MS6]